MTKQKKPLNILALEPYYDGSHRAFLDDWIKHSVHHWTLMTLPGYTWKWRMRHAAITFARTLCAASGTPHAYDVILCSDMLNLAEFRGLAPHDVATLPSIVYFHENQLTYPMRFAKERDYHYAITNLTTAMAADQVWFNSRFHRDSFLNAAHEFLNRMPDYAPLDALAEIRSKSSVHYPGIRAIPRTPFKADFEARPSEELVGKAGGEKGSEAYCSTSRTVFADNAVPRALQPTAAESRFEGGSRKTHRKPGPCRLLWAARWEHDKNPEDFFSAISCLRKQGLDFRLSVIGQSFQAVPESFESAKAEFGDIIDHWGFQTTQAAFWQCLQEADIVVSTAHHEFFGIGMIEAMCAGAYPLLPKRLSYPEILNLDQTPSHQCFFYDGTVSSLAKRLTDLIQKSRTQPLWQDTPSIESLLQAYHWKNAAFTMDQKMAQCPVRL